MEIASQIALVLLMDRAWCGRKRLLIGKLIVYYIKRYSKLHQVIVITKRNNDALST